MPTPQRDLRVQFLGDANSLIRAADKAKRALDDTERSVSKTDKSLGLLKKGAIALGGAFAATKVADFVGDSIQLAIAAEEAGNKFDAVFGPAADGLGASLEELGNKAGIADFELENMVGTTGNVILGLGGSKDEAADFAEALAPLAVDVASFNGEVGNAPDVLKAMTSALTGEREALKSYGIVIREADVQQRALANSGKTAAGELTNLEKATATLELIAEGAGAAVGDLDRNLDSAATTQARLSAEWKEAQAELGQALLPAMTELAGAASDLIPLLGGVADTIIAIADPVLDLTSALDDLTGLMGASGDASEDSATSADKFSVALRGVLQAFGIGSGLARDQADAQMDLSKAMDRSTHAADVNTAAELALADSHKQVLDHTGGSIQEQEVWARVLERDSTPATKAAQEALDRMTGSLAAQRDELRRAADPVFALRDAQLKLAEAQERLTGLQDAGKQGTEEYEDAQLDLISANADLRVAQGELADSMVGGDGAVAAFREAAEAAGLTADEINDIIDSILRYNDTDINEKSFIFRVAGSGAGFVTGGGIPGVQEGGHITKGGFALVGEQGPEIVQLPGGATVHPNGSTPPMAAPSVTINVNGFVGSEQELAREIDRLLTRRSRISGLGFA